MTSNLRYLVFLLIGLVSALIGYADGLAEFRFYYWLPFLGFVYLHCIVDRYQYVALQIAKVCVVEKSPNPNGVDIQILQKNLIPNWTARIYFFSCALEWISFAVLLFTQGWIAVLISYLILFMLSVVVSLIPFVKKNYYSKQIERIQDYVEINTMRFQQFIEACSVSVNEVKETLNEVSLSENPNRWFVEKLQRYQE